MKLQIIVDKEKILNSYHKNFKYIINSLLLYYLIG